MNCFLVNAEPLKTWDLLVDFVKFFLSCVYKSPRIILMTTAVCLQEWQFQPSGKEKRRGEGGRSALNYCIQIYTELSEIIAVTYVSCDGCWHPVLKGVTTVSPSYFCTFLLRQFYQRLPWSEWESSLEHFQGIWVTFFWRCCSTQLFTQMGNVYSQSHLLNMEALDVLPGTSSHQSCLQKTRGITFLIRTEKENLPWKTEHCRSDCFGVPRNWSSDDRGG